MDLILTLFVAPSPFLYLISLPGIVDVLSILPIFGILNDTFYAFSFLRFMVRLRSHLRHHLIALLRQPNNPPMCIMHEEHL